MITASNGRLILFAVVAALAVYRAAVIELGDLPLFYDQAYYYYWSQHPDWGYFSKPPMVAWLIALTTRLWGPSELALNAGGIVLYSLTAFVTYAIGARLYDERTGVLAGIAWACMPIVGFNSLFVSTDAPLLLFWSLTIYGFILAIQTGSWRWWLATGLVAGLGLLSKYSMGVLAVGLLAYLLTGRAERHWLWDPRLWLGIAVAVLVVSPNIWWNLQNDFISFRHTAEISQLDRELFHPDQFAEFFLAQLIVFGPVFMVVFVRQWFSRGFLRAPSDRLMILPAIAMLGVIGLQALLTRAHANWAAPAFVTANIYVVALLVRDNRLRLFVRAMLVNLILLSLLYHYHPIARALGFELKRGQTPYYRILGWRELGAAVSEVTREFPHATLLGDSRRHLAYLSYYSVPKQMQLAWWGPDQGIPANHYQLVADIADSDADEFIFVAERELDRAVLDRFEYHRFLGERETRPLPDLVVSTWLYHLKGFKGYAD